LILVRKLFQKRPVPLATGPVRACLMFFLGATAGFASQIVLPSPSAAPGATILVQVAFLSQASSVSGVQFDVQYDNSVLSLTAALGDSAETSRKNLYAVDIDQSKKRFLIIGLNQNQLSDGNLMNLNVKISPNAANGAYSLTLFNIYGTDPSGYSVAVTGTNGSLTVMAPTVAQPQLTSIDNAASFLPGPVAPGELVTLVGTGIGPGSAQTPSGSPTVAVLAGTSVLFDGTPAPILYASPDQINAIVPYAVSGKAATQLSVTMQGQTIATANEAVAPTAPAIFTLDSTGSGQGAVLNQDSSVNSPANPATKGSIISIFATGAGQTNPPGVDGQVTGTVLPMPLLPVSVQIGGLGANVLYAGAAPELISGVLQVNASIPPATPSGPAVPIVLNIGQNKSQPEVTISIK